MRDKAAEYARRAGDGAASQLAYEEAVRHYKTALTLVDDGVERCELLLALGDAQGRVGDTPAAQQSFRDANDLAESLGLPLYMARAALGYGGRVIWEVSRGDVDRVPLLERALAALGTADSTERVALLTRLAAGPLRDASYPPRRRRSLSKEALEMARRLGDPRTVADALSGYLAAHENPDHTHAQVAVATELVRVATEAGDLERAVEGHEQRAVALLELADVQGAKADFAAMARLAGELRQPAQEWFAVAYDALLALFEGRLAEAERLMTAALEVGGRSMGWNASVTHGLQLYLLRREQGRLAEIEEFVRRAVHEYPTYPIWRCVEAQMAACLGDAATARATLDELATDRFAGVPYDEQWLVDLGLLAETAIALGDTGNVSVLYELLLPYPDRIAVAYPEISTGSVARDLGLLATALERWDDATAHFEQALAANERIGAQPWLAHTCEDYARMLVARGRPGDGDRARALAERAVAGYRSLGMDSFAAEASI
jgi:tetratricopeptide (TPR) repeat protein